MAEEIPCGTILNAATKCVFAIYFQRMASQSRSAKADSDGAHPFSRSGLTIRWAGSRKNLLIGVSVIKISSFSPAENFTRKTWEFLDDHLVIKTKSMTFDYETEVRYEKIKMIQNRKMMDLGWLWATFIIVVIVGIVDLGLDYFCVSSPIIPITEKVVTFFALALIPFAFRQYEYYSFLDAERNYLATVKVNNKSKKALLEAVALIKSKTEVSSETYFTDSLPDTPPIFQITEFDFPDFLNKSQMQFYEDKFIEVEKSLTEEMTTAIKYDELSGKTTVIKMGDKNWDTVWSYWLMFVCITGISISSFFSNYLAGNWLYAKLLGGGLILLIPLFFLRYIKSEILVFHDHKDNAAFWIRTNSANREKLNQIVEFIKGKVESKT
jgi:hypothetical protein